MDRSLRTLGIGNKQRRFDIYYCLPEKLDRWITNRPVGMKHAKRTDFDVKTHKIFMLGKGVD